MKITKSQLKQIIKEELNEIFGFGTWNAIKNERERRMELAEKQKIKEAKRLRIAVGTYYIKNLNLPVIKTWVSVFLKNKESGDLQKWEIRPQARR